MALRISMHILKQIPEDFFVKEMIKVETFDAGPYSYWWLRKTNYDTLRAAKKVADFVRVPLKHIGFAGFKDRHAITEQLISVKGAGKSRLEGFDDRDINLEFAGYGDKPISLGDLDENMFEVVIRNLEENTKIDSISQLINYFDEQRFSRTNHLVGKAIVKGNFKEACDYLATEIPVSEHLSEYPTDLVGAIKKIPLKTRSLFVHAFQSQIFNDVVKGYLHSKYKTLQCKYSLGTLEFPEDVVENIKIPLPGYGTEYENDEIKALVKKQLKEHEVTERKFLIRSMPELSSEGNERDLAVEVKDLTISKLEKDELNKDKKKVKVTFKLKKGCYATMVIKNIMKKSC